MEEDYFTMMKADSDPDADVGLNIHETNTISSLSSTSSCLSSTHTNLLISNPGYKVSPLNKPTLGVGGDKLPPKINDFQLLPIHPQPWHGLDYANVEPILNLDDDYHERFWDEVMEPFEDGLGYQESYFPAGVGSLFPFSIIEDVPLEVVVPDNSNPIPDFNFAASLLLPEISTSGQRPTTSWNNFWSQESPSTSSTQISQPSPNPQMITTFTAPSSPFISPILCSWEQCGKTFPTNSAFNHHLKYRIKPFSCPHCPLHQATKRLLYRHINERHINTEKYYCTVDGCSRSMDGCLGTEGRHFTREDNCRRHLRNMHGISAVGEDLDSKMGRQSKDLGASGVVGMDELTRQIRKDRKVGRRKME